MFVKSIKFDIITRQMSPICDEWTETRVGMTEKEFRKLSRQDLLELLLAQGKEAVQIENQLAETEENLNQAQSGNTRLKTKLDEKDEQIERLKERLDEKDAQINKLKSRLDEKDAKIHDLRVDVQNLQKKRRLEVDEIITALKLDGVFELVQQASDQYLLNVQRASETIVEGEIPLSIDAPDLDDTHTEPEVQEPLEEIFPEEELCADEPEEVISEAGTEEAEEAVSERESEETAEVEEAPAEEEPETAEAHSEKSEETAAGEAPEETAETVTLEERVDADEVEAEPQKEASNEETVQATHKYFWRRWRKSSHRSS